MRPSDNHIADIQHAFDLAGALRTLEADLSARAANDASPDVESYADEDARFDAYDAAEDAAGYDWDGDDADGEP